MGVSAIKGFYSCIGYQDAIQDAGFDIDSLVSSIQDRGGEVAYIYHDKDVGVEPHYHIVCAWAKSPPSWDAFKQWMIDHGCKSPHTDKKGHYVAYHKATCVGRDIDAMIDYLTHPDG